MNAIKPKNFGVIIRTVAEGKKVEMLDQDLKNLVNKWKKMCQQANQGTFWKEGSFAEWWVPYYRAYRGHARN